MNPDTQTKITQILAKDRVVLFMKGSASFPQCGFSARAISILNELGTKYSTVDVLEDEEIRGGIKEYANWPTIPQLFIDQKLVGGSDIMMEMFEAGELQDLLK